MTPCHTPCPGALRVAGLLLVLATGALPPSYAASGPTQPVPTAGASRAGSGAGEGRARPGREKPARRDEDDGAGDEDTAPTYTDRDPTGKTGETGKTAGAGETGEPAESGESAVPDRPEATVTPEASRHAAVPAEQHVVRPGTASEPVLRILPLGSGLILIGLGLGLAFFALRLRRS